MSFQGQLNFGYPVTSQNIITTAPDNAVLPLSIGSSLQGNTLGITVANLLAAVPTPPGLPSFIQYNETNKTFWNAGFSNDTSCVSYGDYALDGATGFSNTGIGAFALFNNTWSYNTAIGDQALKSSSGQQNVAIGYQALNSSQASFCVGIGYQAVGGITASNAGTRNTGVGMESLGFVTTGNFNTAIGSGSLFNITTGTSNIGFGFGAGANLSVGSNNVFLGAYATADSAGISGSIVIGRSATTTASNQFVVGSSAYNAGAITTETITANRTWTVRINGANYKIPLLAI